MPLSPIMQSFLQDRTRSGNTDLCYNLYGEHVDGQGGPEIGVLLSTPGLRLLATIGTGPSRGAFRASNGLMYLVSGNKFYEVATDYTSVLLGTIGSSTGPVSIIDNPTQVLVVDGTGGWVVVKATRAFSQVIPNLDTDIINPNVAIYQDGFGLVNSGGTNQIYESNYNDLSKFATPNGGSLGSTANNAFVQGNPQAVVTMYGIKREAWIFKKDAVEVWTNAGTAGFSFAQQQGIYLTVGCDAAGSVSKLGEGIAWLGSDESGNTVVYLSVGYQAKPISTFALSNRFSSFSTVSDAIAYTYIMDGHEFYVITFPTASETFAYDLATGKWHQRAYFSNGDWSRELANWHCFFNQIHIVGDYRNGNIYAMDDTVSDDNGNPRRWMRTWRALTSDMPVGIPMSFDELQILMETGLAGAGTYPEILLRWSDDGGYNWLAEMLVPGGETGQTSWRVIARRLGSTKIGTGMDRIWEISSTDPIRISITGASFEGGPA